MNTGSFLHGTPLLNGDYFENAIIFLTELNGKGAMGFVVNRQFTRSLNELQEFNDSIPFPLYEGGPVHQEHLFFVHRRPELIENGVLIGHGIFLGGNFRQAVAHINSHTITEKDIKIFIGYCGWDPGELEKEVSEGSWQVHDLEEEKIRYV